MAVPDAAGSGLETVLPGERVVRDPRGLRDYARDCWPRALWWTGRELDSAVPAAAVRPESTEEVAAVLRHCAGRGLAVVPRGGGSGVLGAAVPPDKPAVVLDMTRLAGPPFSIGKDGDEEILRVPAGTYGDVLEADLGARGLSCAHFPASMAVSTLGGWVATDSWGQCSTAYGPFRDRVVSLECVLPGGGVERDVDPHDWIGSEGALGVITAVTFRAIRLREERVFASFEFSDMLSGLGALREMTDKGLRPAVVRLYDGLDRKFLGPEKKSVSGGGFGDVVKSKLLRLRGGLRTLAGLPGVRGLLRPLLVLVAEGPDGAREIERSAAVALRRGALSLGETPARRWWERRYRLDFEKVERYRDLGCFADTLDVFAPWDRIDTVYTAMLRAAKPHGLTMAHASHLCAGGACLYFTLSGAGAGEAETLRFYEACWKAMLDACVGAGGRPDHHHGIGLAKRGWAGLIRGEERLEELRARKRRLDPAGMMNPGKWL